jgi:hypothetical protein
MNKTIEYTTDESLRQRAERYGQELVSAEVYADHARVYFENGQIATIEAEFDERGYGTLSQINARLREEDLDACCWRWRWLGGELTTWANLENESARVHAESALWDEDNHQLVAAIFAADRQLAKAVLASLMTNSDKFNTWLRIGYGANIYLASAKRRYTQVSRSLTEANASGAATAILHPLTGNPTESARTFFYVVATPGEDLQKKFRERLDMALPLAILPGWAEYLLMAGREAGLVAELEAFGSTFAGLRVSKTAYGEDGWEVVISAGLRSDAITL